MRTLLLTGLMLLSALALAACDSTDTPTIQETFGDDHRPLPATQGASDSLGRRVGAAQSLITPGRVPADVLDLLGKPTFVNKGQWSYVIDDELSTAMAVVSFEDGKVTKVESAWRPGWRTLTEAKDHIPAGSDPTAARNHLGEPGGIHEGQWWTCPIEEYAPASVDLFFIGDDLSWGSWYLVARMKKLEHGMSTPLNKDEVRQLIGAPTATAEGLVWDYAATAGNARTRLQVFFRNGKVASFRTFTEPAPSAR